MTGEIKRRFGAPWGLIMLAMMGCATPMESGSRQSLAMIDSASRDAAIEAMASFNSSSARSALRPGDLVRVKFTLAPELDTDQRVLPSGHLSLPYAGLVNVNGKDIKTLTRNLVSVYRAHLNQPDLSITVLEFARPLPAPRVYVLGAVRSAGGFEIDTPITFIEAIALAGGMDERAKKNALAVIRVEDEKLVATIYQSKSILTTKEASGAASIGYLMPGDIIFVPESGLSSAAEISRQVQDLIGFSGYSGSFGYRFRDINN